MRDIVATIQPEQDELVRADLSVSLCVQGGPGTGKTAVGLHRAAYLLFTHRQQLERGGVLVVGPNRALLQFVSSVLPALGELDVEQISIGELYPVDARHVDDPAVAALKHDVRMARVLHRALWGQVVPAQEPLTVAARLLPPHPRPGRPGPGRGRGDAVVAHLLHGPRAAPGTGRGPPAAPDRAPSRGRPQRVVVPRDEPQPAGDAVPRRRLAGRHAGGSSSTGSCPTVRCSPSRPTGS